MIVKLKERMSDYPDLSPGEPYFVIGIEADDFRLLNDYGKPYLYPSHLFEIVDSRILGNRAFGSPSTAMTVNAIHIRRRSTSPVFLRTTLTGTPKLCRSSGIP
jgi:hypothetical protein